MFKIISSWKLVPTSSSWVWKLSLHSFKFKCLVTKLVMCITKLGCAILGGPLVTLYSTNGIVKQQRDNNKVLLEEVSNLD